MATLPMRSAGPERPLLETAAPLVVIEVQDPQISVLLADRIAVAHLRPDHGRGALDGDDLRREREDLVGTLALVFPHASDRSEPDDRGLVRRLTVGGVRGEQPGEGLSARRSPGRFVVRDPPGDGGAVGPGHEGYR